MPPTAPSCSACMATNRHGRSGKMLGEVPAEDADLRREVSYALEQLDAPEPQYEPEPFDIFSEYPKRDLPPFDVLEESSGWDLLKSDAADVRAGAAHSFFNQELSPAARKALLDVAQSDSEPGCVARRGLR